MSLPAAAPSFCLRQLPLPAKLVITCFLVAVGFGYTSAMIQLHMQHSARDGSHLPGPADVLAVFAGKAKPKGDGSAGPSRLEEMLPAEPTTGGLTGKNMTPAFYGQDAANYAEESKQPGRKGALDQERGGERLAVLAWIKSAPEVRMKAYAENRFTLPEELRGKPITPGYLTADGAAHITRIIQDRCARCHKPGGDKSDVPLTTYEEVARFMPSAAVPDRNGYIDSGKRMSLEKLTQSTHAHLLSFAMLFALTGLVFSFSGCPRPARLIVAPLVLVAQVAEVSCWWLARLPDVGVYFAFAILGFGALVGMGLGVQIMGSLWSLYGARGRIVLGVLFAITAGLGAIAYKVYILPFLTDERKGKPVVAAVAQEAVPTRLERLLTGTFDPKGKWSGNADGGMLRALFDKEESFKDLHKSVTRPPKSATSEEIREGAAALAKLTEERKGEQAVLLVWVKLPAEARKQAYLEDRLEVTADLLSKPLTDQVMAGDKAVKLRIDEKTVRLRSLFTARCTICHGPGGEKADIPLETYEHINGYLSPAPNPLTGGTKPEPQPKVEQKPDPKPNGPPAGMAQQPDPKPKVEPKPAAGPSRLEKLVSGPFEKGGRWTGEKDGGMVRAFFDKEETYKDALKSKDPDLPRLTAERQGEQAALVAWIRSAPDTRKKAYEEDRFALPPEFAGKPLTAAFKADDRTLKVKTLLTTRCVECHQPGGEKEDVPLGKYEQLLEYLKPSSEKADVGIPPEPKVVAGSATPRPVLPIPPAKEPSQPAATPPRRTIAPIPPSRE